MDDLVDELSGTTIDCDEEPRTIIKNNLSKLKTVNRSASIINRSKLLILSDSESDDKDDVIEKRIHHVPKYIRISQKQQQAKTCSWRNHHQNHGKSDQTSKLLIKRKRNSCSESNGSIQNNNSINGNNISSKTTTSSNKNDHFLMEIDFCSSSDLSDDDDDDDQRRSAECNFDGDDEQSDFYDCSISSSNADTIKPIRRSRNRTLCTHAKQKMIEFKIPKPVNPFSADFDAVHSNSSLWKRRRPMH